MVRPSYVLGGRAMEIVYSDEDLSRYIREAVQVSNDSPVLLDRFLDNAVEVDVDVIADMDGNVLIGGIMEHIEEAGVHSGDSSCSLPPYTLQRRNPGSPARADDADGARAESDRPDEHPVRASSEAKTIFVLEVNPRASRTVPFVSKAIGVPLAKIAARCMVGQSLAQQGATREIVPDYFSVKEAIFPFAKFQGVDPILGPEMRSTGEVMGVGRTFEEAFGRARGSGEHQGAAARQGLRLGARCRQAARAGRGTTADRARLHAGRHQRHRALTCGEQGIACEQINKVIEGRPHIVDLIKNGEIVYIVNTTEGKPGDRRLLLDPSRSAAASGNVFDDRSPARGPDPGHRQPQSSRGSGRCRNCTRNCTDDRIR